MITFNNLSKSYGEKKILESISLTLPDRGLIGIFGRSGSGKSTLLNLLAALDKPTSGSIMIGDKDICVLSNKEQSDYRRKSVGFIFQDHQLLDRHTVYENIHMGLSFAGVNDSESKAKIHALAQTLNINDLLPLYPNRLSGGERQRVSIARALIKNPKIILADEPTGALDEKHAHELINLLKDISKHTLVLVVSHDHSLVNQYADQTYTLENSHLSSLKEPIKSVSQPFVMTPTKISLKTLFSYAINHLKHHPLRTFSLILMLIISIISVALAHHLNTAVDTYIKKNKQNLVDVFPLEIDTLTVSIPTNEVSHDYPLYPDLPYLIPAHVKTEFIHLNRLDEDFYTYMKDINPHDIDQISYIYDISFNYLKKEENNISPLNISISPLSKSEHNITNEFDVLFENQVETDLGLTLIVDKYNQMPRSIFEHFKIPTDEVTTFETLGNLTFYYADNDVLYTQISDDIFKKNPLNTLELNTLQSASIKRIIRQKNTYDYYSLNPGLYIKNFDYQALFNKNYLSTITQVQLTRDYSVLTQQTFDDSFKKTDTLKTLGYVSFPSSYRISAKTHQSKLNILNFINEYHGGTIIPMDKAQLGLDIAITAFSFFDLIGAVFVVVSLLGSTIMIILSTYTSMLERSTEIGILKTLGANDSDLKKSFFIELLFTSFVSITISLIIIMISIPLLNMITYNMIMLSNVFSYDMLFLALSVPSSILFTVCVGIIPIIIYNRKNAINLIRNT